MMTDDHKALVAALRDKGEWLSLEQQAAAAIESLSEQLAAQQAEHEVELARYKEDLEELRTDNVDISRGRLKAEAEREAAAAEALEMVRIAAFDAIGDVVANDVECSSIQIAVNKAIRALSPAAGEKVPCVRRDGCRMQHNQCQEVGYCLSVLAAAKETT